MEALPFSHLRAYVAHVVAVRAHVAHVGAHVIGHAEGHNTWKVRSMWGVDASLHALVD